MNQRPEALLRRYDAWERNTDKLDFQWRARLLQSLWRDEQGLVAGEYAGKTRGARLLMPEAPIRGLQVHWYVGTIVVLILVLVWRHCYYYYYCVNLWLNYCCN